MDILLVDRFYTFFKMSENLSLMFGHILIISLIIKENVNFD